MRPVIQLVNQEDPKKPKLIVNENGLAVLQKVVLEATTYLSYQRSQLKSAELPKKFSSGKIDKFCFELVLIHPEANPTDPAQSDEVAPA